jgi:hypothetical protein
MARILISAGHQPGLDPGAIGQGRQEADRNIRICDRVVHYLRTWNIDTVYMPNNVGNLTAEINWTNNNFPAGIGYAVQIHTNAGGGTGNEIWTTAFKNQIPLATAVLKAMTDITKLPSRGVKDIITNKHPLGWITGLNSESILIEARFIDRDDVSLPTDLLDAYAIACGIADFLKVPRGKSVEQLDAEKQAQDAAIKAQEQARLKAEQERINAEKAQAEALKALEAQKLAEEVAKKAEEEAKQKALELANIQKAQAENTNFVNWLKDIFIKLSELLVSWRNK